jgi:hypothetical protein
MITSNDVPPTAAPDDLSNFNSPSAIPDSVN